MRMRPALASFLLLACAGAARAAEAPTPRQIQEWWKASSSEELTIEGPLQEVRLMDKEVAFIAPVGFYQRGRNFIWHAALIRPQVGQVRELPSPIENQNIAVLHLDDDEASVVMSDSVASGGGSNERTRSIVRFDGFTPIVMHVAVGGDNLGNCGARLHGSPCKAVDIDWAVDNDKAGATRLMEAVTTRTGRDAQHLTSRKTMRRYVLSGNHLVRDDGR